MLYIALLQQKVMMLWCNFNKEDRAPHRELWAADPISLSSSNLYSEPSAKLSSQPIAINFFPLIV